MNEMSRDEFERQKNDAANRIREMYSGQKAPSFPAFVSVPSPPAVHAENEHQKEVKKETFPPPQNRFGSLLKFLNFSELTKSPDALLILGIILLLLSDNADEKLILALVFILL